MIIGLSGAAGTGMPNRPTYGPVVRLAVGTVLTRMQGIDGDTVFRDLEDVSVGIRIFGLGSGTGGGSRAKPGRVAHRKSDRVLTVDIEYDEVGMALDKLDADANVAAVPTARDYLAGFAERIDLAVQAQIAWLDRKSAWNDRARFVTAWEATVAALRSGDLTRPYEFAIDAPMRDALDTAWSLLARTPLGEERFQTIAEAYLLLRDAGWADAEYVTDAGAPEGRFGPLSRIANLARNLASAPPPGPEFCYTIA